LSLSRNSFGIYHHTDPHETDQVDFRPFWKTTRGDEWAVSKPGKAWILERINEYEKLKGPFGVDEVEGQKRLKEKQKDWIASLASQFMKLWPNFDWREVLGNDKSEEEKKKASRVSRF
jgi:hypothetical protein